MKAPTAGVDSSILIYASLVDHPAMQACDRCLSSGVVWVTSALNLAEVHHVLRAVYGPSETEAGSKVLDFARALEVEPLTGESLLDALHLRLTLHIDLGDASLLVACQTNGVSTLATDDVGLAQASEALGIAADHPIGDDVRAEVARWEAGHLPAKGMPRILRQVHRWIDSHDRPLAQAFYSATQSLSRLV